MKFNIHKTPPNKRLNRSVLLAKMNDGTWLCVRNGILELPETLKNTVYPLETTH
jgi:hypothetical protein